MSKTTAKNDNGEDQQQASKAVQSDDDPRRRLGRMPDHALQDLLQEVCGFYEFCTENILEYLPYLHAKGKRCLTLAASGDQVVNLLMAGAKEIVAFDTCEAACEVMSLKMQGLADICWDDAKQFRAQFGKVVLDPEMFRGFAERSDLPFTESGSVITNAVASLPVGRADMIFKNVITGRNAYIANKKAFTRARSAVGRALEDGRVSFVAADVRDLPYMGLGQFDVIVLSNILQSALVRLRKPVALKRGESSWWRERLDPAAADRTLKVLIDQMVWPVANMLTPGGVMMASYNYGCEERPHDEDGEPRGDPLKNTERRQSAFTPPPGFIVEEACWETVNSMDSGVDVAVFVRRS